MFEHRASWISSIVVLLIAMAGVSAPAVSQEDQPEDAILILDASGSMWGQIEGVNKIVIAKDVVEGLVRSLPVEQRLGLVAYGHRRKGDCADIETLADVGGSRDDMIKEIRGLNPKGKTPLTDSVQYAAENLNYTKNAATVILVSDGVETCASDPCALARTLEEKGLDLTVHVVGFDVTEEERKSLACIAEETGGEFLPADNADELADALTQVAAISVPPPEPVAEPLAKPQTVALKATMMLNGPDIQSRLNWEVAPADGGEPVFTKDDAGYVDFEVVPGDYVANVVWTGWPHEGDRYGGDKSGSKAFTIFPQRPAVVTVPIDLGIPVTLEIDDQVAEGEPVNVTWSGPDDLGASITMNGLEDGPREQIYFTAAQRARDQAENKVDTNGDGKVNQDDLVDAQVGGPSVAGDYEVRYVLSEPRLILARVPITVIDTPHVLTFPGEVAASSKFDVDWTGEMTPGDFLTIVPAGSETAFTNGVTARLAEGEPATLTAFAEPGDYEVRYILANGYTTYEGMQYAVQESAPLTIVDVSASISAPDTAVGGSDLTFDVEVPGEGDWKDDTISIIEVGTNKTNSDARQGTTRIRNEDGRFTMRVPALAGDYEIAYFLHPGSRVIAREPLTITTAEATVNAPDTARAGEPIEISYSGEAFHGDRVVIVPADTPDEKMWQWSANYGFIAKADETTGTIRSSYAAKTPGEYEVRYVTGLQNLVLARDTITITE